MLALLESKGGVELLIMHTYRQKDKKRKVSLALTFISETTKLCPALFRYSHQLMQSMCEVEAGGTPIF